MRATFSDCRVTSPGNPVTIRAVVGGSGFTGPSQFGFAYDDEQAPSMAITA